MDIVKKTKAGSSSSSSSTSFDHLFGPKGSASSASSCSTILDSIFPPPVARKKGSHTAPESQGSISQPTDERSSHEKREASYFSSSIYYGGQQHYSPPRTDGSASTSPSHESKETDNRTDPTPSTSRGNWWKGSLYY
ncbi:PREDICTED: uncharacterized protein LOC104708516 [Camelina sativa]|uniref:Uncharacterized protein LOC104708516 n=1 Tax=Camelina sativa TaxID=90675 RepID=A0ABM0TAQ8_CAMSA|nr:PREDICTED: uncharacterized protein LOC104708516 [Camelina sativa]